MSTTEMKNADALNSIYLTCDESGDVSIWGGRPDVERSTMNGDLIKLTIKSVENRYNVTNATVEVEDVLDYIEKHKYKLEVYVF